MKQWTLSNNSQINIEDIQELPVNEIDNTENLEETEPIEQDTSITEESLEKKRNYK